VFDYGTPLVCSAIVANAVEAGFRDSVIHYRSPLLALVGAIRLYLSAIG
jgi:hypothetical protein